MPTYFQKPENALKRANEFIDVGKKERALESLYDVIKSKKHRAWQMTHESIMEQYLELCVDLRKSNVAKEGLYQYKNICQISNITSLVNVVRKYITMAEEKTDAARLQSKASVLDVDDLDMPESPETILLKVVSGEDTQARADRTILMPWVKFLWESYRQCLDLLRNNSRVENLYQEIAQQAFKFCLKYSRNTEFRKLCENLRNHLQLVHKHQHQATAINLNNPETQALHLETRLAQLDSAIKMELWQEAFKAVEDIHSLIALSKKSPKPSLMANYYQKLSLVFWKSGSYVFHACSLHRLFNLQRDQRKNITQAELQKMAARVVCATLAIPIQSAKNAIDQVLLLEESTLKKERHLSTLLMLTTPPSRAALIQDLVSNNILMYLPPELQDLYANLEVTFHPLSMYEAIKPSLDYVLAEDNLAQYAESLEDVVIARLVKQTCQLYQTIELSRLHELVPFATQFRLERVIVNLTKSLEMQIRIYHNTESLTLGSDLMVSQREDVAEGPYLQSMPSERIRNQLSLMTKALHKAIDTLDPRHAKIEHIKMKEQIVNCYRASAYKDHMRLLQRRQIIEEKKEQLEHYNTRREEEELKQEEVKRRKVEEAERLRREAEAEQRERQRLKAETENIRRRHTQDKMKELRQSELGVRVLKTIDEAAFEDMTVEDIVAKQVEQLEKEKKVFVEKLKAQEKKIDYNIRARRLVEIPVLREDYETQRVVDKQTWEEREQARVHSQKQEKQKAKQTRERLSRMTDDRDIFLQRLKDARKSTFMEKAADFERKLSLERKKRLVERKIKRKEERRQNWIREKEEADQKKRDEQLKREREEKEAAERQKREEEEREYEENEAKLRERESRIIEEIQGTDERKPATVGKWQPTAHSGGWRERLQNRDAMWSGNEGRALQNDKPSWQVGRGMQDITMPAKDWRKDSRMDDRQEWRTPPEKDRRRDGDGPSMRNWRDDVRGDRIAVRDPRPLVSDDRAIYRDDRQFQAQSDRPPVLRGDRPSSRDDPPPFREDRPPLRDDRPPLRDDRPPLRDDRPPLRDDRPPLRDDRPPLRDDRPPFRDDRQPLRDDRPPIRDDRLPDRADRPLKRVDQAPDGMRPVDDRPFRDSPRMNPEDRSGGNEAHRPPLWVDRRGPPVGRPMEERGMDDRGAPMRDDRSFPGGNIRGTPPRDFRDMPPRDDRRAIPRDIRGSPSRDDRHPPLRGGRSPPRDRPPAHGESRSPPRYDRPLMRDERGAMSRDERAHLPHDERGYRPSGPPHRYDSPPRENRSRDTRGPPRQDERNLRMKEDREPRADRPPYRDDRNLRPRDDHQRSWRNEGPDSSWRRDDMDGRRSDDRRDDRPRRDEPQDLPRSDWRQGGPFRDVRRGAPRDIDQNREGDRRGRDDPWRRERPAQRNPPSEERRDDWRKGDSRPPPTDNRREPPPPSKAPDDDTEEGWTKVRRY